MVHFHLVMFCFIFFNIYKMYISCTMQFELGCCYGHFLHRQPIIFLTSKCAILYVTNEDVEYKQSFMMC